MTTNIDRVRANKNWLPWRGTYVTTTGHVVATGQTWMEWRWLVAWNDYSASQRRIMVNASTKLERLFGYIISTVTSVDSSTPDCAAVSQVTNQSLWVPMWQWYYCGTLVSLQRNCCDRRIRVISILTMSFLTLTYPGSRISIINRRHTAQSLQAPLSENSHRCRSSSAYCTLFEKTYETCTSIP